MNTQTHAGQPAIVTQAIITALDDYGLLAVDGEDAATFLQNQFSNDVRQVNAGHSQLNSYCTAKGRMLCTFRLTLIAGTYYLRMPAGLLAAVHKRLQMFVLRSRVRLEDASTRWQRSGIAGPGCAQLLAGLAGDIPQQINDVVSTADWTLLRLPGVERFEIYLGASDAAQHLRQKLFEQLIPADNNSWPLLDILAGIPTVYPQTSEHFVPQMTNLQLIDGVSFKKGCYPGQEVVARMQYLGSLKRRMYLVSIDGNTAIEPGSGIVSTDGDKTHEAGEIVDARPADHASQVALAVLPISSIEQPLRMAGDNGAAIRLLQLPYGHTSN